MAKIIQIGSSASIMINQSTPIEIALKDPEEADPLNFAVSYESPLGRSLLNKKEGEYFRYMVGPKIFSGKILKVFS